MKNFSLFILFSTFSFTVFSQVVGGTSYEKAYDMISGGEYLYLLGHTSSYGEGNRDAFVVKYNTQNETYTYNTWGKTDYDEFRSICKAGNDFIIAGFSFWREGSGIEAIMTKMNSELEFEWLNHYGNYHYQHAYKAYALSNGDYLMGGVDRSIGLYGPLLARISSSGETIWGVTYEEYKPSSVVDILELDSGNILLLCSKGGYFNPSTIWHDTSNPNADLLFVELNLQGGVVRDKIIEAPHHDIPVKILKTADNKFYCLSHSQSYSDDKSFDICLSLIDSDYEIEWVKTFGGDYFEYASDMAVDDEGNIHILGTTASENEDFPVIIYIKTDGDGNELETRYVSEDERSYGAAIEVIDTSIYILGTVTNDSDDNFILFKNFELGEDTYFVPELYIYPNPTRGICKIKCNSRFLVNSFVQIQIYNVQGRLVYSEQHTFANGSTSIGLDLSSFLQGQYIVKISNSEFSETLKVIVLN